MPAEPQDIKAMREMYNRLDRINQAAKDDYDMNDFLYLFEEVIGRMEEVMLARQSEERLLGGAA